MASNEQEHIIRQCLALGIYKFKDGRQLYEVAIDELKDWLRETGIVNLHSTNTQ